MLPKVSLWSLSMLGNITRSSKLLAYTAIERQLFNKCDDLYHVTFRGYELEVGEQKNEDRLQFYHRWHACIRFRLSQ